MDKVRREGFSTAHRHGGRISDAMAAYPDAPLPWLDLSTGINPQPWKGERATLASLWSLPDPAQTLELEASAAAAFGAEPAQVAATPGAESALRLLPRMLRVKTVDIVGPTYGGHEDGARALDLGVRAITASDMLASRSDLLVVVNPNNPDGRRHDPAELLKIARARAAEHRWLLVDESFIEASPELSLAGAATRGLIVLRSFGKFYGLPGVRLGFVVAQPDVTAQVRSNFGDWPVSADAVAMGTAAYADSDWRMIAAGRLERQAGRLDRLLEDAGFEVLGGTSLFRLATRPDAALCFERLCAAGILTRPFAYDPTWIRFGLPGPGGLSRLNEALGTLDPPP